MQPLRIALLAPLKRAITPDVTASRPRVIFVLANELVRRGHTVTLFGTGDSIIPGAAIVPVIPTALTQLPPSENPFYQHTAALLAEVKLFLDHQKEFDIVHNHMYPEYYPFLADGLLSTPMLTTIHSQMTEDMKHMLHLFPTISAVAISRVASLASGVDLPVVHNGIDTELFCSREIRDRTYLLFVGRMSKAKDSTGKYMDPKGVGTAIAIAKQTGIPLKIVGNVEDPAFFNEIVKPHLSTTITYVGELSVEQTLTKEEMVKLFQGAIAFLNPINWEEPFGLVMAEAASCGTPVVAYNRGSVQELIKDGQTGFIIDPDNEERTGKGSWVIKKQGIEGLVEAVNRIGEIDRLACREHAVEQFTIGKMVDGYEVLYQALLQSKHR